MPILPAIANISFEQYGFVFLLILSTLMFFAFIQRLGIFSKLKFTKIEMSEG